MNNPFEELIFDISDRIGDITGEEDSEGWTTYDNSPIHQARVAELSWVQARIDYYIKKSHDAAENGTLKA